MPYQGKGGFERASPLGHVATVKHPLVATRLAKYRQAEARVDMIDLSPLLIDPRELAQDAISRNHVIAVDGSPFEQEIDPRYPSTRSLFLQVGGVLVDLERMRERRGPFADPSSVADAQRADVFAGFLPSSNLISIDGKEPRFAFREELYTLFSETIVSERSLLEVLLKVLDHAPDRGAAPDGAVELPCPACKGDVTVGAMPAICVCGETVFASDVMRVHEIFNPYGPNSEAAGRVLRVCEQLTLAAFLLFFAERQPASLGQVGFIADGSLAFFGEAAKLRSAILTLWQRTALDLTKRGHRLPLLIGVEKSGEFVDHAKAIAPLLPAGRLMRLPLDYIKERIRFREADYGKETYYGRKFIYKTNDERILVFSAPPLTPGVTAYGRGEQLEQLDIEDYPTLRVSCDLLDRIGTQLYDDALMPIALAHQYVAYPLQMATNVLKLFSEQHLGAQARPSLS